MAIAFKAPIFTSLVLAQRRNGEISYTEFYQDRTINMGSTGINTFTHVGNYNLAVTEPDLRNSRFLDNFLEGPLIPNFMNIRRTV